MKLIVTRPYYDIATKYISSWAEEVIFLAQTKKIDVIDLEKGKANRKDFESRVNKLQPRIIFLNGHGGDDCVFGQDEEVLVKAGVNHDILQGRITYSVSCSSGKELGFEVAKDGKSTFIGYEKEFILIGNLRHKGKLNNDASAKPFMESSNLVMISLLKGNTAKESSDRSKAKFEEHLAKLSSSQADFDTLRAMQALRWNARHQVCLGNQNASLENNN